MEAEKFSKMLRRNYIEELATDTPGTKPHSDEELAIQYAIVIEQEFALNSKEVDPLITFKAAVDLEPSLRNITAITDSLDLNKSALDDLSKQIRVVDGYSTDIDLYQAKLEAAEAKLAKIEKNPSKERKSFINGYVKKRVESDTEQTLWALAHMGHNENDPDALGEFLYETRELLMDNRQAYFGQAGRNNLGEMIMAILDKLIASIMHVTKGE